MKWTESILSKDSESLPQVFAAEQGTTDCSRTEEVLACHLSKSKVC